MVRRNQHYWRMKALEEEKNSLANQNKRMIESWDNCIWNPQGFNFKGYPLDDSHRK